MCFKNSWVFVTTNWKMVLTQTMMLFSKTSFPSKYHHLNIRNICNIYFTVIHLIWLKKAETESVTLQVIPTQSAHPIQLVINPNRIVSLDLDWDQTDQWNKCGSALQGRKTYSKLVRSLLGSCQNPEDLEDWSQSFGSRILAANILKDIESYFCYDPEFPVMIQNFHIRSTISLFYCQ